MVAASIVVLKKRMISVESDTDCSFTPGKVPVIEGAWADVDRGSNNKASEKITGHRPDVIRYFAYNPAMNRTF